MIFRGHHCIELQRLKYQIIYPYGKAEINGTPLKIPNWLTFELLLFFADLSAGLAGSAAAIGGQEERGDCET